MSGHLPVPALGRTETVATDRYEISTRIAVSIAIRARQTEAQMTDDERFSMIIRIGSATRFTGGVRDKGYPN